MMIRSASTPVLGSLLQSHHESPNISNNQYPEYSNYYSSSPSSFHPQSKQPVHHCMRSISSSLNPRRTSPFSSPSAYCTRHNNNNGVVRRAQSTGNLEGLVASYDDESNSVAAEDDATHFKKNRGSSGRLHFSSALQTIPSFSYHNSGRMFTDEEEYTDDDGEDDEQRDRYIAGGADCNSGGGGSGDCKRTGHDEEGPHGDDVEEHYRKMVEGDPTNPLFLRNYAQFLYRVKGDLAGAEEYYSRAILEDPTDGDILSSYAKIIWELHRDQDRAESYYDRAVRASPEDSHVLAAHASFLWEVEDDEEEEEVDRDMDYGRLNPSFLRVATV